LAPLATGLGHITQATKSQAGRSLYPGWMYPDASTAADAN